MKETRKSKLKRIGVRVVGKHGKAVIIERVVSGEAVRAIAPVQALEYRGDDVLISKVDLDASIPYGANWEKHLEITITVEKVAAMLRRRGVWTPEDYKRHFVQVRQGVLGMISQDLSRMFKAAEKEAR